MRPLDLAQPPVLVEGGEREGVAAAVGGGWQGNGAEGAAPEEQEEEGEDGCMEYTQGGRHLGDSKCNM